MASVSVLKTWAVPGGCQMANVFKGGTNNPKYNRGDRCVFGQTDAPTSEQLALMVE